MSSNRLYASTDGGCTVRVHMTLRRYAHPLAADIAVNLSVIGLDKFTGGASPRSPFMLADRYDNGILGGN